MGIIAGLAGGLDDLVDLAVPRTCGGCGAPRVRWCTRCERALHDVPARIRTTVDVGASVWTLGRYDGARRGAVLQLKERGRGDLAVPLGRAVAHAVLRLHSWGEFDGHPVLVPAPTTRWAARRRGGDVVTALCRSAAATVGTAAPGAAGPVRMTVAPVLRSVGALDSVGLGASARAANVAGTVRVRAPLPAVLTSPRAAVILVDDVVTTGATLAESVAALRRRGVRVALAVTVAAA